MMGLGSGGLARDGGSMAWTEMPTDRGKGRNTWLWKWSPGRRSMCGQWYGKGNESVAQEAPCKADASFVGMTPRERTRMHIALLRVISHILSDIATAIATAMADIGEAGETVSFPPCSLDRMGVDEARRCAQGLLLRVFVTHARRGEAMTAAREEFVAGLTAYGADMDITEVTLTTWSIGGVWWLLFYRGL